MMVASMVVTRVESKVLKLAGVMVVRRAVM